jgi:hypothetical protein
MKFRVRIQFKSCQSVIEGLTWQSVADIIKTYQQKPRLKMDAFDIGNAVGLTYEEMK